MAVLNSTSRTVFVLSRHFPCVLKLASGNTIEVKSQSLHLLKLCQPSACFSLSSTSRRQDDYDEGYEPTYRRSPRGMSSDRFDRPYRPNYGKNHHQRRHRDIIYFDEDEFSESRTRYSEPGANLSDKKWTDLPPLEKNFYVENPSVLEKSEIEVNDFYTSHNISVERGQQPLPIFEFGQANFPEKINAGLAKTGWSQPTPIQSIGWPLALSGKNIVAIAQTGSGKTLGFILPALNHIKHQCKVAKGEGPIALVLAPTRELAQQIQGVAVQYGRLLGIRSCVVFGGQSKLIQARNLSEGPDIVVATPGRLLDFLEMDVINLDRTSYVVLDEADRMLDMGFEPQIRRILGQIRPDRQMLMWSATWPREIQKLAHDFLGEFTQVNIGSTELTANSNITQLVKVCERREKFDLLVSQLQEWQHNDMGDLKALIFAQTKAQADFITHKLRRLRFKALAIHGDKSQLVRDKTLRSFRDGYAEILVATDVAARGLDVNDIKLVINYDYPNNVEDYIHRIGRTGRADKKGTALSFITDDDAGKLQDLITVLKDADQEVPEELVKFARLYPKFKKKGPSPSYGGKRNYPGNYSRRPPFSDYNRRRDSW